MENLDIATESGWSTTAGIPHTNSNVDEIPTIDENTASVSPSVNGISGLNTTLLDADDLVTPSQINADKPIWRHPLPRTALVMVGVGAIGLGVIHLTQGNGSINPNSGQVVQQSPTPVATASVPKGDDVKAGKLQAQIATIKQQQQLDELKKAKQTNAKVPTSAPPKQFNTVQPSAPVPVTTPPRPRVVAYNPPKRVYSQPIPVRRTPALTTPVASPRLTSAAVAPTPTIDPMEQWLAAANVGSYGSTSPVNNAQPSSSQSDRNDNYQTTNYQSKDDSLWATSGGVGTPPKERSAQAPEQSNSTYTQANNQANNTDTQSSTDYQNVNYKSPANSLIVGTKASGKLTTAIAWSGKLENPNQNFLIQLNEPLKTANNTIAIPKGAYLVAKVSTATEAGLLQMSVSSMLVNENGQTSEKPVPEGSLLILGKGGRPLKASAERPDTSGNDLGTVVLSGVATATGLINRPSSASIYSSNGYQSTITNGNSNYLAGFGEGAAQSLLQQAQNRNQQSLRSRESEPTVFVLNQGAIVQVFVNQSVSL